MRKHWSKSICHACFVCLAVATLGCVSNTSEPGNPTAASVKPNAKSSEREVASANTTTKPSVREIAPPKHPILFQPKFYWADPKESHNGTGFIAKAPNGKQVGITSAHFLRLDGLPLLKASWLDVRTMQPIATFTKSWGRPGNSGIVTPTHVDLRSDYLLLVDETAVPVESVLELDERELPVVGERIWFPNKNPQADLGYELVEGHVTIATAYFIAVALDAPVTLQSQSGSPIISRTSGGVIGTLSRGAAGKQSQELFLAPVHPISKVLRESALLFSLEDVIGKLPKETK